MIWYISKSLNFSKCTPRHDLIWSFNSFVRPWYLLLLLFLLFVGKVWRTYDQSNSGFGFVSFESRFYFFGVHLTAEKWFRQNKNRHQNAYSGSRTNSKRWHCRQAVLEQAQTGRLPRGRDEWTERGLPRQGPGQKGHQLLAHLLFPVASSHLFSLPTVWPGILFIFTMNLLFLSR